MFLWALTDEDGEDDDVVGLIVQDVKQYNQRLKHVEEHRTNG